MGTHSDHVCDTRSMEHLTVESCKKRGNAQARRHKNELRIAHRRLPRCTARGARENRLKHTRKSLARCREVGQWWPLAPGEDAVVNMFCPLPAVVLLHYFLAEKWLFCHHALDCPKSCCIVQRRKVQAGRQCHLSKKTEKLWARSLRVCVQRPSKLSVLKNLAPLPQFLRKPMPPCLLTEKVTGPLWTKRGTTPGIENNCA